MNAIADLQGAPLSFAGGTGQSGGTAYPSGGAWTNSPAGTWVYSPGATWAYSPGAMCAYLPIRTLSDATSVDWNALSELDLGFLNTITGSRELDNLVDVASGTSLNKQTAITDRGSNPATTGDRRFTILQQWEGIVTDVDADVFFAILRDLTDPDSEEESAEIFLSEVSDSDRAILKPGSVFYWIIGFAYSRGGQKSRVSEIRARRTPEWTKQKIELTRGKAAARFQRAKSNG